MASILVPTEDTPVAARVLPIAGSLARASSSDITLLQVVEPRRSAVGTYQIRQERSAFESLRIMAEHIVPRVGRLPEIAVRVGPIAETIIAEATSRDAFLIVMATHSREGLIDALLGNVAAEVVEQGLAPVALVPSRSDLPREWEPRQIIVSLDGSPVGQLIVAPAERLAEIFGAKVSFEQAYGPEIGPESSDVSSRIIALARQESHSLVALATRGRLGLGASRPSPTAASILRRSDVPLLTFGAALLRQLTATGPARARLHRRRVLIPVLAIHR